jgi:hypothetical protein
MIYLEQQQMITWRINISMVMLGFDGHLVVSEEVIVKNV